jgi:TonB family protein
MLKKAHIVFTALSLIGVMITGICAGQDTIPKPTRKIPNHLPSLPLVPEFPGGRDSLKAFINKHMRYPEEARKHNISGKVEIDFWVDEEGNLSKFKVNETTKLGYGCEKEALRIAKKMPKWKPGMNGRTPMAMDFHINVTFGPADNNK